MDAVSVIRNFIAALNRNDWPTLQALLHPTFQRHSLAAEGSGEESAAEFIEFLREEHRAYPDAHEELLDVFSSGARVAARAMERAR